MNSIEVQFKLFKEPKTIETQQEVTYLKNSFLHDVVNQVANELAGNLLVGDKSNYPDWLTYPGDLTKQVLVEFTFQESESSLEIIGKVIDSYVQKFIETNPNIVVYQIFTLSVANKIQLFFNFFVRFGYLNKSFFAISLTEAIDKQVATRKLGIIEWKKKELSELDLLIRTIGTKQAIEDEEHTKLLPNVQKISLSQLQLKLDDLVTETADIAVNKKNDTMEKFEASKSENFYSTMNSHSGWNINQKVNLNEHELLLTDKEQIVNLNIQVIRLEELTSKLERKLVKAEIENEKTQKFIDSKEGSEAYLKNELNQKLSVVQDENNQLTKKIIQLESEKSNYEQEIKGLQSLNKNFQDQNIELIKTLKIKEKLLADLEEKYKQRKKISGSFILAKPSHILNEEDRIDGETSTSEQNSFFNDFPEPDFEDMTKKKMSSKEYKELIKTVGYIEHIWSIYQTKLKNRAVENKEEQVELDVLLERIDETSIETFIFSHELAEIKDQVMVRNSILLGRSTVVISNYDLQSLRLMEKQYYLMGEAIKELSKRQLKEDN